MAGIWNASECSLGKALKILAVLLEVPKRWGLAPTCIRRFVVFLIDKLTGGMRRIALLSTVYRAWARGRRQIASD